MPRTTSKDTRPRIDISRGSKLRLKELKKHLGYKQESDVIAYLISLYDQAYKKLTVHEDKQLRERAADLMNQEVWKE